MRIRLGLCSAYSFLYGVHNPGALLEKAAAFGVTAASIGDLNNLYGVHTFLEAAKERGIRPVIGAALTMRNEETVYCFVENRSGYGRLCEILTLRNRDKENFNPLPPLTENAGGLALASADGAVLEGLAGKVKRLYRAITPSSIGGIGPSRKLNIPLCFLDNSIFLDTADFIVHKTLRAIALLKTVGSLAQSDTAGENRILRTSKDLHRLLVSYPQAVKGTQEIAELCQFEDVIPVKASRFMPYIEQVEFEIKLLKGWRRANNKIEELVAGRGQKREGGEEKE